MKEGEKEECRGCGSSTRCGNIGVPLHRAAYRAHHLKCVTLKYENVIMREAGAGAASGTHCITCFACGPEGGWPSVRVGGCAGGRASAAAGQASAKE